MFKKNAPTLSASANQPVSTIIGEQCILVGNIESSQSVKIDGRIEGNINVNALIIISEKATIIGDVQGQEMIVYGQISGNIHCDTLQLKDSARLVGEISTNNLQIEAGAKYQGSVHMNDNQPLTTSAVEE